MIAFQAVTTRMYGEPTLASCTVNGEPGIAIVLVDHIGEGKVAVMLLFVAITPSMSIVFAGEGDGEEGGCGPKTSREEFAANKTAVSPSPR